MSPFLFGHFVKMRAGDIAENFSFLKTLNQKRQRHNVEQRFVPCHAACQHIRHRHQSVADSFEQFRSLVPQGAASLNRDLDFPFCRFLGPFGEFGQADAMMVGRRPDRVGDPFYRRGCFCRFGGFAAATAAPGGQ